MAQQLSNGSLVCKRDTTIDLTGDSDQEIHHDSDQEIHQDSDQEIHHDSDQEIHHDQLEQAQALVRLAKDFDLDKLLDAIRFQDVMLLKKSGFEYGRTKTRLANGRWGRVCVQPGCDLKTVYQTKTSFFSHIHAHHLKLIPLFQCPECGQKVPHITVHMAEHEARDDEGWLDDQVLTLKKTLIRSVPGMSEPDITDLSKSFNIQSSP